MRITLVTHRFPPDSVGGVERYTESLAWKLLALGATVSVITRWDLPGTDTPQLVREELASSLRVYRIMAPPLAGDRFLEHHAALESFVDTVLAEERPEIVHVNHLLGHSPRLVDQVREWRSASVLTLHDFFLACPLAHLETVTGEPCDGPALGRSCATRCFPTMDRATARWGLRAMYYRDLIGAFDRVICPSEELRRFFVDFGAPPDRVRMVENGTALAGEERVSRHGRHGSTGPLRVAFVGTVAEHKGVHVLLEAAGLADPRPGEVNVFGDMPDRAYATGLREVGDGLAETTVRFFGRFDHAVLPALLEDADCVVIPSLVREASPLVAREALAQGIPVIASDRGGLREIVVHGENGLLFDPTTPAELASHLAHLGADPSFRDRLRAGAAESVVASLDDHAAEVLAVYREAIGERHMPVSDDRGIVFDALRDLGF